MRIELRTEADVYAERKKVVIIEMLNTLRNNPSYKYGEVIPEKEDNISIDDMKKAIGDILIEFGWDACYHTEIINRGLYIVKD